MDLRPSLRPPPSVGAARVVAVPRVLAAHPKVPRHAAVGQVVQTNETTRLAYIGLGGNLGDARHTLTQALSQLDAAEGVQVMAVSPFYRSAPVQAEGPDFINAVAQVRTSLPPLALLDVLQAIEQAHHRQRPYRNAPRTLD
ncbi:MAG: 2-amino-4-hydroxy-6-hydroxymethyldihydropteridine diphosphokinase, partial [Comamonadaceae bacterium]